MATTPKNNSRLYLIVSLTAVVAYAALIEWIWGWRIIFEQWSNWSLTSTLLAIGLMFCTYLLRAYRIRDYFRSYSQVSYAESCRITLMHNLANNLLPMRSGEASFPLMMRSSFNLPISMTTGTLLFFRTLDLQVLLALGALAWISQVHNSIGGWILWLAFLLCPIVILPSRTFLELKILCRLPKKLSDLGSKILSGTPENYLALLRTLLITWLNWSIKVVVFAWILVSFAELEFVQAITGAMGGELSSVLPLHAPAGVGTYEAGVVAGAALTGANLDTSVAAAVNLHLLIILGTLIGGLIAPLIKTPVILQE
jgi:uncharacterized membrane protein YbhN (UPF0104 family)